MNPRATLTLATVLTLGGCASSTAPTPAGGVVRAEAPRGPVAPSPPLSGELAFMRAGEVWLVDVATGAERAIASDLVYALERPLCWLPDGTRLVIWDHTRGWVQWAVDPATGEREALTPESDNRSPAFTRDGRRMAWISGGAGLCVRDLPDGAVQVLSPDAHRDVAPDWSPDGRRVVWVSPEPVERNGETGVRFVLHTIHTDGTGERRVAAGDDPDWAPSGDRIAFAGRQLGTVNADGSDVRWHTSTATGVGPPAWSPTGDQLACIVEGIDGRHLTLFPAGGGNPRTLARVEHSVYGNTPRWSPDGQWIAWMDGPRDEERVCATPTRAGRAGEVGEVRTLAAGGAVFPVWRPR